MIVSRNRRPEQNDTLQVRPGRCPQPADKVVNLFFRNHVRPRCYQLLLPPPPPELPPPNPPNPPPPPNPPSPQPPPPRDPPPPPNIPERRIQKSTPRSGVQRTMSTMTISRMTPPADRPLPVCSLGCAGARAGCGVAS